MYHSDFIRDSAKSRFIIYSDLFLAFNQRGERKCIDKTFIAQIQQYLKQN